MNNIFHRYLVEGEGLCERKAPASLKGASDHCAASTGRSARQSKRVLEGHATHGYPRVYLIDWCVKEGQGRLAGNSQTL